MVVVGIPQKILKKFNMSHPIQFRVWDVFNKKYLTPSTDGLNFIFNKHWEPLFKFCSSESYIVQQFIGIFDVNGKEIYEGDIIRNREFAPVAVYFDDKVGGYYPFYLRIDPEREKLSDAPEVIGNIFQKVS